MIFFSKCQRFVCYAMLLANFHTFYQRTQQQQKPLRTKILSKECQQLLVMSSYSVLLLLLMFRWQTIFVGNAYRKNGLMPSPLFSKQFPHIANSDSIRFNCIYRKATAVFFPFSSPSEFLFLVELCVFG